MSRQHNDPTDEYLQAMMSQSYFVQENTYAPPQARLGGPASHYDGVAFWYRPNLSEQLYQRDSSLFARDDQGLGNVQESANVKHRRTRSGCFTCRNRRVKCDETRPICERCKKGGRDCEFPQVSSASKRARHSEPRDQAKHDDREGSITSNLETIEDESDEEQISPKMTRRPAFMKQRSHSTQSLNQKQKGRNASDTPLSHREKQSPHSVTSSSSISQPNTPVIKLAESHARQAKVKALKPDLQKYLEFQRKHMTYYHYFFKLDPTDFVHNEFIDQALSFEPLLYAVVGFAAYHYELRRPNGKLSNFLGYHSKSLSLLRKSLESHAQFTKAMLLTVLQLATFEEFIGDWVNLNGHHRAAHTMILRIFTAESMMESDLGRRIFSWYGRLDIIASLMGGAGMKLERSWFKANAKWYYDQVNHDPESDFDVESMMAYIVATGRLVGYDLAALFSKAAKSEIDGDEFQIEHAQIAHRLEVLKTDIQSINDDFYTIKEFTVEKERPLTDNDIVNPYIPGGLFKAALWPLNYLWIDWYAIEQMSIYQSHSLLLKPLPAQVLEALSLEQCRIYEAIERWPDAPEGAILGAQASLGLALVFLRSDDKHVNWARQKLASVERLGYVFPPAFRQQMAERWGLTSDLVGHDESVDDWWLSKSQGHPPPPIVTEIRKVVRDRHSSPSSDRAMSISGADDIREMKAIFAKLDLRNHSGMGGLVMSSSSTRGSLSAASTSGHSPQSEGARSASSAGLEASPTSAAGAVVAGFFAEDPPQEARRINKEKRSSRMDKKKEKDKDRMSGIWSS